MASIFISASGYNGHLNVYQGQAWLKISTRDQNVISRCVQSSLGILVEKCHKIKSHFAVFNLDDSILSKYSTTTNTVLKSVDMLPCLAKSWHCQQLGRGLTHAHRICLIWFFSIISRHPQILLAHVTTQVCDICNCLAILYDLHLWHLTLNQWQYFTSIF